MKLYFAWVISLVAILVSFYFGEVLGMEPCRLCWYQRMAIFPLALFLGIAAYKNDRKVALYALPLVFFGALMAAYQSLSGIFPTLHSAKICGGGHCTDQGLLPILSFIGFSLIAVLIFAARVNACKK